MESVVDLEQDVFEPPISEKFSLITQYINLYYTPLLCLFGGFGNCVSLYIFCLTSSHRNLSSSYYLSALAISDTGFLINLMALWLTTDLGFNVITTKISCPLVMFLGQVTCFLSVWFVVAFTVERFFAVCYPLTRPSVCTVARAKKVILGITCTALIAFSYVWVIAQVVEINIPDEEQFEGNESMALTSKKIDNLHNWTFTSSSSSVMYNVPTSAFEMKLNQNQESSLEGKEDERFTLPNILFEEFNVNKSSSKAQGILESGPNYKISQKGHSTSSSSSSILPAGEHYDSTTSLPSPSYSTHLVCSVPHEYHSFSRYANYLDSFFTLILPFCIITFLNIRITICVWKLKGQRETIVAVVKSKNNSTRSNMNTNHQNNVNTNVNSNRDNETKVSSVNELLHNQNSTKNKKTHGKFSCSFVKNKTNTNNPTSNLNPSNNTSNTTSPTMNVETTMTDDTFLRTQPGNEDGLSPCSSSLNQSQSQNRSGSGPDQVNTYFNNSNNTSHSPRLQSVPNVKLYTPTTARRINHHHNQSSSTAAEVRVTKTLLLVSTVFLVLNLPSHAMRATAFIQQAFWPDSPNQASEPSALHQWAYILFNTNFGVNFLLYCVSGRNFRKSLYSLLCCMNHRNNRKRRRGLNDDGENGGRGGRMMMMMRNHPNKRRYMKGNNNASSVRRGSSCNNRKFNGGNNSNNNISMRRRVLKSLTTCPSIVLHSSVETNNKSHGQINLSLENIEAGRRRQHDQDENERRTSIQSDLNTVTTKWRTYDGDDDDDDGNDKYHLSDEYNTTC